MAVVRFPFTVPKDADGYRSLSVKYTKHLTELKCNNERCSQCHNSTPPGTFSERNLPGIAYCGHHACKDQVKLRGELGRDGADFICKHCPRASTEPDFYLRDKLLEEFFTVIAQGGVECDGCKGVHPQYNSVRYIIANGRSDQPTFVCVWCATTKDPYWQYKMVIIPNELYNEKKTQYTRADSVYREVMAGWAMNLCCICREDTVVDAYATSLSCGHLCENACVNIEEGTIIHCNLCGVDSKRKGLNMFNSENLEYLKMGEIKKCDGVCKLNHPIENCVVIEGSKHNFITNMFESFTGAKKVWCVWCVVEKMVQDRMD